MTDADKIDDFIQTKNYVAAQNLITKGIEKTKATDSQKLANYYFKKGQLHFSKFEYDSAIQSYNQSLNMGFYRFFPGNNVQLTKEIAEAFNLENQVDSSIIYYQLLSKLAKQNNDLNNYAYALSKIAYRKVLNTSIERNNFLSESMHIADSLKNKQLMGMSFINIAGYWYPTPKKDSTIYYYHKAIDFLEKSSDTILLISAYNNIGDGFMSIKAYDSAIHYLKKGYELALKTQNSDYLITICANIGDVKLTLKDYAGAKSFYLRSLEYGNQHKRIVAKANSLFNLGLLSLENKEYEAALKYFGNTIGLYENDKRILILVIKSYVKIATVYLAQNNLAQAKAYCLKTLEVIKLKENELENAGETENETALILSKLNEFNLAKSIAIKNFQKFDSAKDYNNLLLIGQTLFKCYEKENNYNASLKYLKLINCCKDSIEANAQMVSNGKLQAQIENKNISLQQQNMVQALDDKLAFSKKLQTFIIAAASILVFFIGILFYQLWQNKKSQRELKIKNKIIQKQNEELVDSNLSLENFARITSHDISGPVKSIAKLNAIIQNKYEAVFSKEEKNMVKLISANCSYLIEMITGFLNFSIITKNLPPSELINLNSLIESIKRKIAQQDYNQNLSISVKNKLPEIEAHTFLIVQLFYNLITNSIKYSKKEEATKIEIESSEKNGKCTISVKDNGIGIPKSFQDKAFDLFAKHHKKEEYAGQGIGLSACKKIITHYGGKIWLESVEGTGTTIYFTVTPTHY